MKIPAAMAALAAGAALILSSPQQAKAPTRPEEGKPAPTFTLNDHEGKKVSVGPNDDALWTVLAFYPMAATPG